MTKMDIIQQFNTLEIENVRLRAFVTTIKLLLLSLVVLTFFSCNSLTSLTDTTMSSGFYEQRMANKQKKNVYIQVTQDSLTIIQLDAKGNKVGYIPSGALQVFVQPSFDIDVLTVPFKYRPAAINLPRQLTADFNGNVYFGYRLDRYSISDNRTPEGIDKQVKHRAITIGTFGGLGTSAITPWTTNNQTTDEYSGFVVTRGLSLMAGVNNYTVGFGVGWDYLTDRDRGIWNYQNKPWYGMSISLNIN